MIDRYARKEMKDIWSDETKYSIWLDVELTVLEVLAEKKIIPEKSFEVIKEKATFSIERINKLELELKHDVIAFLTSVAESVGPESRYLHYGMTSSDLLDTSTAIQLKRSGELILTGLNKVIDIVLKRAEQHRMTPCIGRSHGIHAEPITFGVKLLTWYVELKRHRNRIETAIQGASVGKLSGAVGTYTTLPPDVESQVMAKLGLSAECVSTQVVHRDRYAVFFTSLALLASSIERFCIEIRHLQRTEVSEVEESFTKGQKGSSAMPHKRNPILSENLTGLARLLRSYAIASMENIPLWHERDISHSSVERVIGPDSCILSDFILERFRGLVEGLVVYPDRMRYNLELTGGLVYSGGLLIALVEKGMTREEAYAVVQKHAMSSKEGGESFRALIEMDGQIRSHLSTDELSALFDPMRHLQHIDEIFNAAFKER